MSIADKPGAPATATEALVPLHAPRQNGPQPARQGALAFWPKLSQAPALSPAESPEEFPARSPPAPPAAKCARSNEAPMVAQMVRDQAWAVAEGSRAARALALKIAWEADVHLMFSRTRGEAEYMPPCGEAESREARAALQVDCRAACEASSHGAGV